MLFKVYAQCCKAARPIEQVDSINEAVWDNIYSMMDSGEICNDESYDEDISDAWEKLTAIFTKTGRINAGDYQIVKAPHRSDVRRPNMCGWEIV